MSNRLEKQNGIRIKRVNVAAYKKMAAKDGRPMSVILCQACEAIALQYPNDGQFDTPTQVSPELHIYKVPEKTIAKLKNVANFAGVDLSTFLKVKLAERLLLK